MAQGVDQDGPEPDLPGYPPEGCHHLYLIRWLAQPGHVLQDAALEVQQRPLPELVLEWLAERLPRIVCASPMLSDRLLLRLAANPDSQVRKAVADKAQWLPLAAQLRLAGDPEFSVRIRLSKRTFLAAEAVEILSRDPDANVRGFVASLKRPLPGVMLERLAGDPNAYVRNQVRRRPGLPTRLLLHLAEDSDWVVQQTVGSREDYLELKQARDEALSL